jgi:hypothetical protein
MVHVYIPVAWRAVAMGSEGKRCPDIHRRMTVVQAPLRLYISLHDKVAHTINRAHHEGLRPNIHTYRHSIAPPRQRLDLIM